jgi:NAD(P)H-nitrite reductase large subunit
MTLADPSNKNRVVIIGAGAAGESAAQTLRKNGFSGEIRMISNENTLPYDRVALSKNFKVEPQQIWLRPQEFYDTYGIQIQKNSQVQSIDTRNKAVALNEGSKIEYDKLIIASGSSARILNPHLSAASLSNVCSIRNVADHLKIKSALQGAQRVVIIGGSFLGLEAANSIKSNFAGVEVTVIEVETVPLKRIMGEDIGKLLKSSLEAKGVKLLLGKTASSINSGSGKASSVTVDGVEIPLDVLLLATGASINTSFVPQELLNSDGSVRCSAFLQTDDRHVYAAGDVANYLNVYTGDRNRIEHWSVAQEMGKVAALNVLGRAIPFSTVPFFWSNQAVNIQFVGFHGELGHHEVRNRGTANEGHISYFFKGNQTVGVAIANWPGAAIKFRSLFDIQSLPTKSELHQGKKFLDL